MNQVVRNVKGLLRKYPTTLNSDMKLSLAYWREYENLRMDSRHVSTKDLLGVRTSMDDIINARYVLELLNEGEVSK